MNLTLLPASDAEVNFLLQIKHRVTDAYELE
jgi:hypothetical protein